MNAYIKKIYDMMYSPIVSPYNLLENAKLDNYSYVKYYKATDGLVVEMECEAQGEGKKVFYYFFDAKDYLQKIYVESSGVKELIFERSEAIESAKEDYYQAKPIYKQVI